MLIAAVGAAAAAPITLDDYWLTFLVSVALPMLTAVVKQRFSASWVGSLVLLALAVLSGWLTSLVATGGTFELRTAAVSVAISFITAVGVHYGLLKPMGVTGNGGVILRAMPGGVGTPEPRAITGPLLSSDGVPLDAEPQNWPPAG